MNTALLTAVAVATTVNTAHLDWLRRPVALPTGGEVATWQIYAAPVKKHDRRGPYRFVGDEDEGIGCVDDVARAAIVYAREYAHTGDAHMAEEARAAYAFLAHMARPGGTYANFIWADGSLNLTGPTSKPGLNWWTARALWALAEGARAFRASDPAYAETLRTRAMVTVEALQADLSRRDGAWRSYGTLKAPGWFISDAPDVTAVAVLGLAALHADRPSAATQRLIARYGDALSRWRSVEPDGALLPGLGPTSWHAYGAHMLHALAAGGKAIGSASMLRAARREADGFMPHLLIAGGPVAGFTPGLAPYPQIAYGVEPAVCGLLALAEATGEARYEQLAGLFGSWLTGNNPAGAPMYDAATGRVWDGIDRKGVSEDSGAESTIEGLMTLQALRAHPRAMAYFAAREVARVGPCFLDAEKAPGAKVVAAPGLVGDRAASLAPGGRLRWTANLPKGRYTLTPVALRDRHIPAERAHLVLEAAGLTRQAALKWPPAGAPWPAPEAAPLAGRFALNGPTTVTITYAATARQPVRLDGVIAQPDLEYRLFSIGSRRLVVAKNLSDTPSTLNLPGFAATSLPPHGAVVIERPVPSQETR